MKLRIAVVVVIALAVLGCNKPLELSTGPTGLSLPPLINSFTADATRLATPLLDTFLRWDVTGTADTRCRIDSPGQASQSIGNVPLGGFVQIRPQVSRDYVLTCTNTAGTSARTVSIIVG